MPVENRKSTQISNADATPPVLSNSASAYGTPFVKVATIEVAAADDDNSIYRMVRLPSNAVVSSIMRFNDAITAGTSYDIGIYQTAANGGAVVDADLFASAVDLSTASVVGVEQVFEALNIDKIGQPLWQILGLTSDPGREYDLALTANTVGSAAGTISVRVLFSL